MTEDISEERKNVAEEMLDALLKLYYEEEKKCPESSGMALEARMLELKHS